MNLKSLWKKKSIASLVKGLPALGMRHVEALWIVFTIIVPAILRSGQRPVVFVRHGGIGDILCSFPVALELKKQHPKALSIFRCHPDFAFLPKMGGVADLVITTPSMDTATYWYPFLFSGHYQFDYIDRDPNINSTQTLVEEFASQHGIIVSDEHTRLEADAADIANVRSRLKRLNLSDGALIVIHPGPTWPVRELPHATWCALIQGLRDHGFTNIIQIGTSKSDIYKGFESGVIPGAISLTDQLPLNELFALISLSDLFVGIDSGPLHIAASVGTPAVSAWGPTFPQFRFSKAYRRLFLIGNVECQGCHHRQPRLHSITGCPFNIACMKSIRTEDLVENCLSILNLPRRLHCG